MESKVHDRQINLVFTQRLFVSRLIRFGGSPNEPAPLLRPTVFIGSGKRRDKLRITGQLNWYICQKWNESRSAH